jgi:hypothetical protein
MVGYVGRLVVGAVVLLLFGHKRPRLKVWLRQRNWFRPCV